MQKNLVILGHHWSKEKILISALWGIGFFVLSLLINYLAGTYATAHMSNPVNDLILDNIPTFDVDGIFVYGILLFFIFVGILIIHRPRRAPFILKSLSLFIMVRSFFIILTHLAPSLHQAPLDVQNRIVNAFTFTGDLFFSGHTGLPFLMALIFWKDKILRNVFFMLSVFFGAVVLLGHLHYSIDVFSAFFITYGIFQISLRFFQKDSHLLNSLNPKSSK
jgi:hypothetical protein